MTCIAAVVDAGRVWMGADSLVADDAGGVCISTESKVFRSGAFTIGSCGAVRLGQLLRTLPLAGELTEPEHVPALLVQQFVPAVQDVLANAGLKSHKLPAGSSILVGLAGRLFAIDCEFAVIERADGFDAIGSGADFALGSLFETDHMTPAYRVRTALECAAKFSTTVRPPFVVLPPAASWVSPASTPEAPAST